MSLLGDIWVGLTAARILSRCEGGVDVGEFEFAAYIPYLGTYLGSRELPAYLGTW